MAGVGAPAAAGVPGAIPGQKGEKAAAEQLTVEQISTKLDAEFQKINEIDQTTPPEAKKLGKKENDKARANLNVDAGKKFAEFKAMGETLVKAGKKIQKEKGCKKLTTIGKNKENIGRALVAIGTAELAMARNSTPAGKAFEANKKNLEAPLVALAAAGEKEGELAEKLTNYIAPLIHDPKSKLAKSLTELKSQIEVAKKLGTESPMAA